MLVQRNCLEYREHTKAFKDVGAYITSAWNVAEGDQPQRVNAGFVSHNMFGVLGVKPMLGDAFTAEQDTPNGEPVVIPNAEGGRREMP